MSFKIPISVLVVIYTKAGDVLLLKRKQPEDFWQSVTGSLQENETPMQTAIREVSEETSIDVQSQQMPQAQLIDCGVTNRFPILPAWRHKYAADVQENVEHVFQLVLSEKPIIQLSPTEHSDFIWLPKQEAIQKVWSSTNREAIQQIV